MAVKRKKSAWEEARDFLTRSASNVAQGVSQTVNKVQNNTGTFYDAFKKDLDSFNRTNEARQQQSRQATNNLVSRVLKSSQQGIDTVQNTGRKAFDYFDPTKDVSDKPGVQNLWTSRPMQASKDTLIELQTGSERLKASGQYTAGLLARTPNDFTRNQNLIGLNTSLSSPLSLKVKDIYKGDLPGVNLSKKLFEMGDKSLAQSEKTAESLSLIEDRGTLGNITNPKWVKRALTMNAPGLLTSLGAGIVTGFVTRNPQITAAVTFSTAFPQNAGEIIADARQNGATDEEAAAYARLYGTVASMLDVVGFSQVIDRLTGGQAKDAIVKTIIKDLAVNSLKEGTTESIQTLLQNAVAKFTYDPERALEEGVVESGVIGSIAGTPFGGISAIDTITRRPEAEIPGKTPGGTPGAPTAPTETNFRTITDPAANAGLSDIDTELLERARVHKSADEFMQAEQEKGNVLYRGAYDDELKNNTFFADFYDHAKQYADEEGTVQGLRYEPKDVYHFGDREFEELRNTYAKASDSQLRQIYDEAIKEGRFGDAQFQLDIPNEKIVPYVRELLASGEPYSTISNTKRNDFLTPLLQKVASDKGKNIVSFEGSDYYGATEYLVGDTKKLTNLSDVWEKAQSRVAQPSIDGATQETPDAVAMLKQDIDQKLNSDGEVNNQPSFRVVDTNLYGEAQENLTTKLLIKLQGQEVVEKTVIINLLNEPGIRPMERFVALQALNAATKNNMVNVETFAREVRKNLLPIHPRVIQGRWESINLPENLRGQGEYHEVIYESPIESMASTQHYMGDFPKYFAHVRYMDMADGTRRILEVQSDLLFGMKGIWLNDVMSTIGEGDTFFEMLYDTAQDAESDQGIKTIIENFGLTSRSAYAIKKAKQDLELEYGDPDKNGNVKMDEAGKRQMAFYDKLIKFLPKEPASREQVGLENYRQGFVRRIVQEEIVRAAKDGKIGLSFPTGDTSLRIEDRGLKDAFIPRGAQEGMKIPYEDGKGYVLSRVGDTVTIISEKDVQAKYDALNISTLTGLRDKLLTAAKANPEEYDALLDAYIEGNDIARASNFFREYQQGNLDMQEFMDLSFIKWEDVVDYEIYSSMATKTGEPYRQIEEWALQKAGNNAVAIGGNTIVIAKPDATIETTQVGKISTNKPLKQLISDKVYERVHETYEKHIPKELSKLGKEIKTIIDENGIGWNIIQITPEDATMDVAAYREEGKKEFDMPIEEVNQTLSRMLGEAKVKFVGDGGKIVTPDGQFARGKYFQSLITVLEEDGKVESKTIYHEAFHQYVDKFVNKNLYQNALNEVIATQKVSTKQADEILAEGFAEFRAGRTGGFSQTLINFFNDLAFSLRKLVGEVNSAELIYHNMIQGNRGPNQGTARQNPTQITAYANTINNGGTTIDLKGMMPDKGFAFSPFRDTEMVVAQSQFTPEIVTQFIEKNEDKLKSVDNYLGIWYNETDGNIYLDVSTVKSDQAEALRLAEEADQIAIFNLETFEEIKTPKYEKNSTRSQEGISGADSPTGTSVNQGEQFRGPEFGPSGVAIQETAPIAPRARRESNPVVKDAVRTYAERIGLPPVVENHYVPINETQAQTIAEAYEALPEFDNSPETIEAYQALAQEVQEQWDYATQELGIQFEPWVEEGQPYDNSLEMVNDIKNNGHLYFFTGGEPHPFLGNPDENGLTLNDKFRAIHDLFGHSAEGYGFGPRGEENAWIKHSQMFTPLAQAALTTETRGQNSWVNFGPQNYDADGNPLNIPPEDRPYARQKVALLPPEMRNWQGTIQGEQQVFPQFRVVPQDGPVPTSETIDELRNIGSEPTLEAAPASRPIQPEGLKTPIHTIDTDTLLERIQGKSKFIPDYRAELERRGINPDNPTKPKERGHTASMRDADNLRDGVKEQIQGTYTPTTDEERLTYGREFIKNNPGVAITRLKGPEPMSNELEGIYIAMIEDYQVRADAAEAAGNIKEANSLDAEAAELDNLASRKLTTVAQTLQFARRFSQKSPTSMLRWAQRMYEQANQTRNLSPKRLANKLLGREYMKQLTPDMEKYIVKEQARINRIKDADEKLKATQVLMRYVGENIPPSLLQYTEAYRYQNMLINPRTQLRNLFANGFNAFFLRPATIGVKSMNNLPLKLVGKDNGSKPADIFRYYIALGKATPKALAGFAKGWKGENMSGYEKQQEIVGPVPYNELTRENMPKILTIAGRGLQGVDLLFTEFIANAEYAVLRSQGKSEEEALKDAYQMAAQYLYRKQLDPLNTTGQGKFLSGWDKGTEWLIKNRQTLPTAIAVPYSWMLPFIRVPMAVAKMSFEYNPVTGGLTLAGSNQKSEQIAKMQIGAMVMVWGASLAAQGLTTWELPDDEKQRSAYFDSGRRPRSFYLNGHWVPFNYLGPLGFAMAVPAAWKYYKDQSRNALVDSDGKAAFQALMGLVKYFGEATPVSGLGGLLRTVQGDIDFSFEKNLAFTSGQAIPLNGLVTFIAQAMDPVYRNAGQGYWDNLAKNIPGLSDNLPAYEKMDGTPSKRTPDLDIMPDFLPDWMQSSASVLPYTLGTPNEEFEKVYQGITKKRQEDALINKRKKDLEKAQEEGSVAGIESEDLGIDKVFIAEDGKVFDLRKIDDTEQGIDAYDNKKDSYEKAREIWKSKLSPEDKQKAFSVLGVEPDDVRYDYMARFEVQPKTEYLIDKLSDQPHEVVLERLMTGRVVSLSGEIFASKGVLDNLVDANLISKAEAKWLNSLKYDVESGKLVQQAGGGSGGSGGSGSGGGSPTGLKFNIKSPNVSIAKLSLPSAGGRQAPRLNLAPTQRISFKVPQVSSTVEKPTGRIKVTPYQGKMTKSLSGLGRL